MFGIINRYLAYSYILPFMVSTAFFVMFLLTFQLFKVMRLVVGKGIETMAVIELLGHIALTFVPLAVPLAVLFSTLFTINKLSTDSEFVAMRSIGLTKEKLIIPFLAFATLVGVTVYAMNTDLVPYAKREFRRAVNILSSEGLVSEIQKGNFFTEIPGVILFAENVSEDNSLSDVFINVKNKTNLDRIIFAKKGELIKQKAGKWGLGEVRLTLSEGSIINLNSENKEVEKILFEKYDFPVTSGNINDGIVTKARMQSSKNLKKYLNGLDPNTKRSKDEVKAEVEYWSRINTPFLIFIFTLLGFSLGVQKTRGKGRNTGVTALLVLIGYYVLFFGLVSVARSGSFPAWVSVFTPTLVGLFVGIFYFRKLEWVS